MGQLPGEDGRGDQGRDPGEAPARLLVLAHRTDRAELDAVAGALEALHGVLNGGGPRRRRQGAALEVMLQRDGDGRPRASLAVRCPAGAARSLQAALRSAYPNVRLLPAPAELGRPGALLTLRKRHPFTRRLRELERLEGQPPPVDRLLLAMAAVGGPVLVQIAVLPAPAALERLARELTRRREGSLLGAEGRGRTVVDERELRGGLDVAYRALFFCEVRVAAQDRRAARAVAAELHAGGAENALVARVLRGRRALDRLANGARPVRSAGGRNILSAPEVAALWHLPSPELASVPLVRCAVPVAPASPLVLRPSHGRGLLCDEYGPVSIHPSMRRQHVAVPGAVEQGKTSVLLASVAEDLERERCALIVLDPKGDAAEAALGLVPADRACTFLDLARPECGFNPLDVHAPADVVADYVVGAMHNLFAEGEIRGSSDRYLRNAIIAVLAFDRRSTLWDAARLLSVGEDGRAFRARVGSAVRSLPSFAEISRFFAEELPAQLADSRAQTTSKLDAPVNKLARLLNSPSIKRVLLNRFLTIDLDRIVTGGEVLIVRGALGSMGAGNTAVLMQLLLGMLDAALARQQDLLPPAERTPVALKVDEAPLVINRGFADTMALKRSAGLEVLACWQADAQWEDPALRAQLDALFAHRVLFATASVADAEGSASLLSEDSPPTAARGAAPPAALTLPNARLHLPRHHAIVSLTTPAGRQPPFVARTHPFASDPVKVEAHRDRQRARGAAFLEDLSQPPWQETDAGSPRREPASLRDRTAPRLGAPMRSPAPALHSPLAESTPPGSGVQSPPGDLALPGSAVHSPVQESTSPAPAVHSPLGESTSPVPALPAPLGDLASPASGMRSPVGDLALPGPTTCTPVDGMPLPGTSSPAADRGPRSAARALPAADGQASTAARAKRSTGAVRTSRAPVTGPAPAERSSPAAEGGFGFRPRSTPAPAVPGAAAHDAVADLALLDDVRGVRWRAPGPAIAQQPDAVDLEVLDWIGVLGTVLSSQIHRRFHGGRSLSSTQRRCRRLAQAGLVERFQYHRADGGGVPDCCRLTPDGAHTVGLDVEAEAEDPLLALGRMRRRIWLAEWMIALERRSRLRAMLGGAQAVLHPPRGAGGRSATPGDLVLAGGRVAHDFLRSGPEGRRPAERLETVRPELSVIQRRGPRLLVETDMRPAEKLPVSRLERYDHLLTGWDSGSSTVVVVLLRDEATARAGCEQADGILLACRAYAGEDPQRWDYRGRDRIRFASLLDLVRGRTRAWAVSPLPPALRPPSEAAVIETTLPLGGSTGSGNDPRA